MNNIDVYALTQATYSGPLTFACRPFDRGLAAADIAVVGVPFDMGTTYRPGARFGPRAVRVQLVFVGQYPWGHWPWDFNIWDETRVVDWGDAPNTVMWPGYPDRMVDEVRESVAAIHGAGVSVFALGGGPHDRVPAARCGRRAPRSVVDGPLRRALRHLGHGRRPEPRDDVQAGRPAGLGGARAIHPSGDAHTQPRDVRIPDRRCRRTPGPAARGHDR
ncbi:MAG: hypothetical protein FJW94_10525 [Actinobacteria bacterium]|nr:hypothetical protein [Actinomycetota bacterium]